MRRAVVTGGAGFIGRATVGMLLDEGWSVVVLDDLSSGTESNLEGLGRENLDVVEGGIEDQDAVARAFLDKPELCLHLAARINVQRSIDDPDRTYRPDVLGTLNVLEAARAARSRFLFMSSCMVYGPAGGRAIAEDHPVRPASPYAASKLAGETLTISYGLAYGHPVVVVRPFNTYGPYQRADGEGGVVAIFCDRALAGEAIDVFGDGTQTRDLLYVDDCAEFLLRAAAAPEALGKLLNAGTGRDVPINELARVVGGPDIAIRHVEHPHPQAEIARLVCDASLADRVLGWTPVVSLETGVERTKEWLRTRTPS